MPISALGFSLYSLLTGLWTALSLQIFVLLLFTKSQQMCSPPTSSYHLRASTFKGPTDKAAVLYRFLPPLCTSISLLLYSLAFLHFHILCIFTHNSFTVLCCLHPNYPSFQDEGSSSFLLQSYTQDRILLHSSSILSTTSNTISRVLVFPSVWDILIFKGSEFLPLEWQLSL